MSSRLGISRGFALRALPVTLFLAAFLVAPLGIFAAYSLGHNGFLNPSFAFSFENYLQIVQSSLFRTLMGRSIEVGLITGAACVILAFPFVYAITHGPLKRYGTGLLFLVLTSLFSAYIVRVYAWRTLLGRYGVVNSLLSGIGVTHHPVTLLLYDRFGVIVTLVNNLLPFAILPLYSALAGIDPDVISAARSLGASPSQTLRRTVVPLASRGIVGAFALCFILASGDYITPELVGDPNSQLVGNAIENQFGIAYNVPLGSALGFGLVIVAGVCVGAVVLLLRAGDMWGRTA